VAKLNKISRNIQGSVTLKVKYLYTVGEYPFPVLKSTHKTPLSPCLSDTYRLIQNDHRLIIRAAFFCRGSDFRWKTPRVIKTQVHQMQLVPPFGRIGRDK
jgi:hypothetical protein